MAGSKPTKLSNDMILLLLPLLIAGLFFTVIVAYSRLVNVRGTDFYYYYKNELKYNFDNNTTYHNSDELMETLSHLDYIDDTHTDFFKKYIFELSDSYDGRVYEHYAVNTRRIY